MPSKAILLLPRVAIKPIQEAQTGKAICPKSHSAASTLLGHSLPSVSTTARCLPLQPSGHRAWSLENASCRVSTPSRERHLGRMGWI